MGDHVFICYARQDQDFALKLAANLKERGARVWLDQWDISPSADWDLTIDKALYDCAQFLIVLSPAAVASGEVRGELRTALDENKPIVPVIYQKCRIPRRLKLIQHVDFTARGPDDGAALGQVLHALGVSEPSRPTPKVRRREEAAPTRQPFEPEMVLIPAGEFLMGSDPSVDNDAQSREQPQHTLYLPAYYLAKTPLTNAQYAAFVQAAGHKQPSHWEGGKPPSGKEDHPVVNVSWHDAVAYCRWLAEVTGKPYGLPSEAEWEKGARGDDGRIWPWDNQWDAERCNTLEGGKEDTTPVGAYLQGASPYGLLDMAGNVWEWTRSLWGEVRGEPSFKYPYDPADGREDLEASDSVRRVLRGGAFSLDRRYVRCAFRYGFYPGGFGWYSGFRVVLVAPARQPFEPEMILIRAGEFLMGSDPGVDKDTYGGEQPQHTLYLPAYYLAKTPVTNAQYAAFVQATGHEQPEHWWEGGRPPKGKEDHPVVYVSWHDAVAYCHWLAEVTGKPYRLASEAEWEKGARGGDGLIYPWGNHWDASRCNSSEGGKDDTTPVGAYLQGASPYGLLDMAGNVWEWTRSLWGEDEDEPSFKYPYDPADGREDLEASDSVLRVLRGGAFSLDHRYARCAYRLRFSPGGFGWYGGFRVVLVAPGFPSGL